MDIGILGTGHIGGTLAELLAKSGQRLLLAGRDRAKADALSQRLGPSVSAGEAADALAFGEATIVALPFGAWPEIGRAHGALLRGRVLLDTSNPYPARDGAMAQAALDPGHGSAVAAAGYVPGARLVKAFNTLYYVTLGQEADRPGQRVAIPLAGADDDALAIASRIVEAAGYEPLVVGGLETAAQFDSGAEAYNVALTRSELSALIAPRAA